ncbi:monocarboxylate transporter 1-like isoform X2 [Eriocheir sinensis]|nr:monocarboxylate transporter 1-like isoform X2 [Eriocheir sinensis]
MPLTMFSFGYSILFSDFLLSRGASSTTIAWIFNLHIFLWNAIGVFTGPLTKEFGFRRVSLVGCGLATVCALALVFVDSLWALSVFFALVGMFGGLGFKPCYLLHPIYFDRKRGLANIFLMAGVCSAQFIGPPLIRHFLVEYGRKGATLLLCGIVLQCIVGAALFQPVEWHIKVDAEQVNDEDEGQDKEKVHEGDSGAAVTDEMRAKEVGRRKMPGVSLSRRPSEVSMLSLAESDIDLSSMPPRSRRMSYDLETTTGNKNLCKNINGSFRSVRGLLQVFGNVLKSVIFDMKILRSPRALIIVVGGMLSINAYVNFLMTVPFAIQGAGHSLSDAAWCMSLAAVTNLAARLIVSVLSDQPWFNIRIAYMAGAAIISLSSAVFGFLQSLIHMQVAMAVWGCGVGINVSLGILVMPHIMGMEKMSSIFGANSLILSISMIIFGPLFGFIRDASRSYVANMLAMGCCGGLSVLLWCFMPAAMAYDERKEAEQRREEEREELTEV